MKLIYFPYIFLFLFIANTSFSFLYDSDSFTAIESSTANNSFIGLYNSGSFLSQPAITSKILKPRLNATIKTAFLDNPGFYLDYIKMYNKIGAGVGLAYFKSERFDFIDIYGNRVKKLSFSETLIYINGSGTLFNNLINIGANIKVDQTKADIDSHTTLIFDCGIILNNLSIYNKNIFMSLAIRDINTSILKYQFNILAQLVKLNLFDLNLLLGYLKAIHHNFNSGINIRFIKRYFFNLGYTINSEILNNFGIGAGLLYNNISFFYTIKPGQIDNQHIITLNYFFN